MRNEKTCLMAFIFLALFTTLAAAHHGDHAAHSASSFAYFFEGVFHPLTGLDHLLAMLSVGVFAAMTSATRREVLMAPLCFALCLLAGAILGLVGIELPLTEPMIAVSVLVLGLLLVQTQTLPKSAYLLVIGVFALFHGLVHGAEFSAATSFNASLQFMSGMLLATLTLHLFGVVIGFGLKNNAPQFIKLLGGTMAMVGGVMLLQSI